MCYWLNAEEGADHFPTTAFVVEEIFGVPSSDSTYKSMTEMNQMTDTSRAKIDSNRERNQQRKEQRLEEIDSLTLDAFGCPENIDMYRELLPPSERSDDAKLLVTLKKLFRAQMEDMDPNDLENVESGSDSGGRFVDKKFLLEVNAILPPKGCVSLYDQIWESEYSPGECESLMEKAKTDVRSTWKVNRTMFDPTWTKVMKGMIPQNEFNPIADIGSSFLYCSGVLDCFGRDDNEITRMNFFECTSLFFWHTSQALVNLAAADAVCLELNFGSVTDLCRSIQDGHSGRKFHRMFLSNIPDYIGTMSVFTEILPLLHPPTKSVPSFIQSNVLYNTQLWANYSHYIYSATGIPTLGQCNKLLGLQYEL